MKLVLLLILITSISICTQMTALNTSHGQISSINNTQEKEKYQNFTSDFRILNDTKEWKIISGIWNSSLDGYQGALNESDDTPTPVNAILSPINSNESIEISTSFKINEIADQNPPYVSLIYAFKDPFNYRQAGINIQNGNVYVFANTIDDNVTTDKFSTPVYNATQWLTSKDSLSMSLIIDDNLKTVVINGMKFPINVTSDDTEGKVGLGYGGMQNITFLDFNAQSVTDLSQDFRQGLTKLTDTHTIPLNDKTITESSYIPLYDSRPFKIEEGHIAAKLPCNDDDSSDVQIMAVNASVSTPIELKIIPELSTSGSMCLYHGDMIFSKNSEIYDLILQNNSTDDIDFTSTSGITISIAKLNKTYD